MGRWRVLIEPTVPILLLASIVHAVRQNLFDLLLFTGTAALIIADASLPRRWESVGGRSRQAADPARTMGVTDNGWLRRALLMAAVVALALLVGPFPRDGTVVRTMLILAGGLALMVTMARGRTTSPVPDASAANPAPGSRYGWVVWASLGVLACLWELTSFAIQQSDPSAATAAAHPSVSDLIGPLLAEPPGRIVFLMLWVSAGWWLLHRVAGPRPRREVPRR